MMKYVYTFVAALFFLFTATSPAGAAQNWMQVYAHVEQMINKGVDQYNHGDLEGAKKTINDSYYGVYENDGLEKAIRTTISSKNANLTEYQYSELKKAVRDNKGKEAVRSEADKLLSMMKTDIASLEGKNEGGGRWTSFWPAFLIMLREGMEAILVLVAIMAYLAKSGNKKYLGTVYNYSIAAVVASFVTAYIFSVILDKFTGGASREAVEGVTALLAVAVLLSVGFWMGGKAQGEEWKKYIESMMKNTITTGKARALGLAAFLAVYREGAEVILFYQALFNGASGDTDMIWLGFGAGAVVLSAVFAVIRLGLFRIPLRPFFIVTSLLMVLMAISFAGGGVSSLQEAQLVPQTVITASWFPHIDWIGLYPTYESAGLQLVLLIGAAMTMLAKRKKLS